ncbi:MAG TPA: DUF1559 domain-containing protein [Phycisphaerales bacterium]|nr:DUF1559 domain-containing protein [Phycisphaerales bacterium]
MRGTSRGFTLIELLVVVAIIALLIGILLPSLGAARESGRQIKCAAGMRTVTQAFAQYTNTYGVFPPAYVYGSDTTGYGWNVAQQQGSDPANGYIHWSYLLFDDGNVPEDAFRCPTTPYGGAPRTNPGPNEADWEPGQTALCGSPGNATWSDRQVKRLAFTGNDAIFPRNKFAPEGNPRVMKFVNPSSVDGSASGGSNTILITEFACNSTWSSLLTDDISAPRYKSHRSVSPFVGSSAPAHSPWQEPNGGPPNGFSYVNVEDAAWKNTKFTKNAPPGVVGSEFSTALAVGRHHPGKDDVGGGANFGFVDGHVANSTITKTIQKKQWGDKYFSISGDNTIRQTP